MAVSKYKITPKAKYTGAVNKKSTSKPDKKHVAYSFADTVSYVSDREMVYNYKPFYTDDVSLLKQSKKGLNAKAALDFLALSGFTQNEFQETFKTTVKTIQNHVIKELTLDAPLSEKLLKCFALFDKALEIFGTPEVFSRWLHKPAFGLGYQVPLEMLDTIIGIQLVEEELIRIAYGALA
jgi:putative toxin-antitoxin system antitoxin component (TIGR02293 family)